MTNNDILKFYMDFQTKFPLAFRTIFDKITNGSENDDLEIIIKNHTGSTIEFNNWILLEFKNQGIDAYLGRTIQEKGTLYKPMIVDIREFNSTITYFLVNEDDKQVWQKLAYEEMSEFTKAKHFAGYDSLEIANNTLISKAFGVLNTKLYGQ